MNHTLKKLALCSLVGLFASSAYAHTSIRDAVDEGKTSYNAFNIGHGCGGDTGTNPYPVTGQTGLFPFGEKVVWKKFSIATAAAPAAEILPRVMGGNGGVLATGKTMALSVAAYDGLSSPYSSVDEIVDELGNVQGLHWYGGAMNPKHNALTPFKVTAPTIDNNCVRKLTVRIAAANWCDTKKNATNDAQGPYALPKDAFGRVIYDVSGILDNGGVQRNKPGTKMYSALAKGNGDNNRADWWFMDIEGGSVNFADKDIQSSWPGMTVNNVGVTPEQIAACPGGVQVDAIVEPTGAAFDAYLTGANTQPFTSGASNF